MLTYDITGFLQLIPPARIERELLDCEEDVLSGLRSDIYALEAGFRYLAMCVRRSGLIPKALPVRLLHKSDRIVGLRRGAVISDRDFRMLRRRFAVTVRNLGCSRIAIKPVNSVMFEDRPSKERNRRIDIYVPQVENLDAIHAMLYKKRIKVKGAETARKAIVCQTNGMRFPSGCAAARWASEATGREIEPGSIRSAIRRGIRLAGLRWADDLSAVGEKTPSRTLCPVHCIELSVTFPSVAAAAEFMEESATTIQNVIKAGGKLGLKAGRGISRQDEARRRGHAERLGVTSFTFTKHIPSKGDPNVSRCTGREDSGSQGSEGDPAGPGCDPLRAHLGMPRLPGASRAYGRDG